jgi:hypothetical protein
MKYNKILFMFFVVYFVSACTSHSPIKYKKTERQISKIYLIPTGEIEFTSLQGGLGGGLLGLAIGQALHANSREEEKNLLKQSINRNEIDRIISDVIKKRLSTKYKSNFEKLPISLPKTSFNDWFNPENKPVVPNKRYTKDSLMIEFGYWELSIKQDERCNKTMFNFDLSACDEINIGTGVKIIDSNTGNVVGRGMAYVPNDPIKIKTELTKKMSGEEKVKLYKESIEKKLVKLINLSLDKAL